MDSMSIQNGSIYRGLVSNRLTITIMRALSPKLVEGLHYVTDGPVHQVLRAYGNLTALDWIKYRCCRALDLPSRSLEIKFRAFARAFHEEVCLLSATGIHDVEPGDALAA